MSLTEKKSYAAKVTDAGISQTKTGNSQAFMVLELTDESGVAHKMTWYGGLGEGKPQEYTAKSLINAGFTGMDFTDLEKPNAGMLFDPNHKFTATLENFTKNDGKTALTVKYINAGSSTGPKKITGTAPKSVALFAKIKEELGVKKTTPTTKNADW